MAAIASLTPRIHSKVSWPRDPSRRASHLLQQAGVAPLGEFIQSTQS